MGMFDWVNYPEKPCWKCRTLVSGWQSKDAECNLNTIEPAKVQRFYTSCDSCGAWNEYKVIAKEVQVEEDHGDEWKRQEEEKRYGNT